VSGELAPVGTTPAGFIARSQNLKLTKQLVEDYVAKPLRMLPQEWRVPTWKFWTFWSHILPDQLAVSARLRHWKDDGLTLDDLDIVFDRLTSPEATARFQFPGQLLAEMARLVHERLDRRRRLADMVRAREESAEAGRGRFVGDLGKMPE
jgi:hypothetical protein